MANKPPAFLLYTTDLLADGAVMAMTLEEFGAFMKLLCIAWGEEGIPADDKALCRLLGVSPRKWKSLWPAMESKWESNGNGRLINPRMERVRAERIAFSQRASKAAAKRWEHEGSNA